MLTLEEIFEKPIIELNRDNKEKLRKEIESGEVTWVLGAGVSVPAGLPDWNMLLEKIWARLSEMDSGNANKEKNRFTEARTEILNSITKKTVYRKKINSAINGKGKPLFEDDNLLEAAEYMRNYINVIIKRKNGEEDSHLYNQILHSLLRDSIRIDTGEKTLEETLAEKLKGQAVDEIAEILAKKGKGVVITYNYDDILEWCLEQKVDETEKINVICDLENAKGIKNGKINIYHPHGALKIAGSKTGKESGKVILTESSYYDLEKKAYNWENSIQSRALLDTSCVFVGFSGEDYNFRRIIKNTEHHSRINDVSAGKMHFIFVSVNKMVEALFPKTKNDDEIRKKLADDAYAYEKLQMIQKMYAQYEYWGKHGIVPIWTTYSELPGMIRSF